jgi:alanine racemase
MTHHEYLNRSWAEINLDHIAWNVRRIRRSVHRSAEVMAVVKADAYGHGVEQTIPVMLENGVTRLAVSMLDEAVQLRQAGVGVPILVLSYTDSGRAPEILSNQITQTVYSRDLAQALSDAAVQLNCDARIHIKVDTGMGRVGFLAGYGAVKDITWIGRLPRIIIEGIYTHFATADEEDTTFVFEQFEQFNAICRELERIGIQIPIKHVCNSAATMRFPAMHLDLVRPGLILFGMVPTGCPDAWTDLKPAMTLKSGVILTKNLPPGYPISYGRSFVTSRESQIVTIPIGYADGYSRRLTGKASVLLRGCRLPVIGRICMDTCMVDATQLPPPRVAVGEEVVLFGEQINGGKKSGISVDELASWMGTINYEMTCLIGRRVPRAYVTEKGLSTVKSYILAEDR